jgi:hypothetical protein
MTDYPTFPTCYTSGGNHWWELVHPYMLATSPCRCMFNA